MFKKNRSVDKVGFIIFILAALALLCVALSGERSWFKYVAPLTFAWGLHCIWAYFNKKTIYSLYASINNKANTIQRALGLFVGVLLVFISVGVYTMQAT